MKYTNFHKISPKETREKWASVSSFTTVRPLLSGHPRDFEKWRLIEVGRLIEVQYKLDRKGCKYDFIAFM